MKIKNIKNLRNHYKVKVKKRDDGEMSYTDPNFVGVYHDNEKGKRINGYFELTHGDKKIHKFLPSILKIAEDGQAIYEFIQNAVDCNSSQFFIFYNDKYFLAVNNGQPFNHKDVLSILNIADTTKDDNCENIGRFGIGFKLVHRLVGKDEGIKELVEDYKGPVIFSWNNIGELKQLLGNSPVFPLKIGKPTNLDNVKAPWLFKIIATNFPTEPGEKVRDINYKEKVLFHYSELKEIIEYLKENFKKHQGRFDFANLEQGSLFFLKLGEGKRKLLDNDYKGLENGVQYSMNFLKNLEEVYINDNSLKKRNLKVEEFIIPKGSEAFNEINPEYANCDIKISFGYTDYKRAGGIRKSPNFYKYFPMGDEVNGFSFIVHCDSFDIEANRRKLHDSNKNKKLFPEISKSITQYANELKDNDSTEFLNLYSNILVSEIPERDNNKWLYKIFFKNLINYIQINIPTESGYSENSENVKINKLNQQINLSDFGLGHIQWFKWKDNKADELLIEEAKKPEKLGIEEWDIRDVVENANIKSINKWISECNKDDYEAFLKSLEDSHLRNETKKIIYQIKLFKFSDGKFYSFNEMFSTKGKFGKTSHKISNCIFNSSKTTKIKSELIKIGIVLSDYSINDYPKIFDSITLPEDKTYYDIIGEKCKTNTLNAEEKKNLFLNFVNPETKFTDVGDVTLKAIELFCDCNLQIKPLNKLIGKIKTASWLNHYKIEIQEWFPKLDSYLITEPDKIFEIIFEPNMGEIVPEITEVNEIKLLIGLYEENHKIFFNNFIIKQNEKGFEVIKKENNTFQISSADKQTREFIDENCADNLFVLPNNFLDYKDEEGLIKGNDLYNLILKYVDVDEEKEVLVDILKYKAKNEFLQKLSEFRFNSETKYEIEDYEYKIIELVCLELNEKDYTTFRNKVIIETINQNLALKDIPPYIDKFKIGNAELSLSKVLPNSFDNSNYLSKLLKQFIGLGIASDKLNLIFGVNDEPDEKTIYNQIDTENINNVQQLLFLLLTDETKADDFKGLEVSNEIKIGLLEFLLAKDNIEIINNLKTKNLLGLEVKKSVYPSEFALDSEILPEYIQIWISDDKTKIEFLTKAGLWTEATVIIELRKLLKGENNNFSTNKLTQEKRFNADETMLFNTFEWLKENKIELNTSEQIKAFKKVVETINNNRDKKNLIIEEEFNINILEKKSDLWKEIDNFSIYTYDGKMPKIVSLDEIEDYIFYHYNKSHYLNDGGSIYINKNKDKKKTLQKVASNDENKFSFEELWVIFKENSNREQELENEILKLKQQVGKSDGAILGAEFTTDISKNNQKEANREAKKIVKERLEKDGFNFTQGIDGYSTIDGVIKDDIEYPLVIKSYKYQEEPLKIGVNEWKQLMKPNSMFWVHFGDRKLGCLKLYELMRKQDKLSLSFSTENLDEENRIDKFAELLQYFGNVNFNFDTISPNNYCVADDLNDYRFDDRKTEEDLSSDNENIL